MNTAQIDRIQRIQSDLADALRCASIAWDDLHAIDGEEEPDAWEDARRTVEILEADAAKIERRLERARAAKR